MINEALKFLRDEINAYLVFKDAGTNNDNLVVLTNVALGNGEWAIPGQTLGVSLINIEEEKVFKEQQTHYKNKSGMVEERNPEIKLNIYMLLCSNPGTTGDDRYEQALKKISHVITFFQGKSVFTVENSPAMADTSLKRLVVELYSYTFEQQYNFWSILGAKYLPSVLYKVRLLSFQDNQVQNQNPPVTGISINSQVAK